MVFLTAASILVTSSAVAQSNADAASQPGEIIVKGQRTQKARIGSFVKTLTPARSYEQIGRFLEPVCPAAVGLAAHENSLIEARLRQIIRASGARLGRSGCRPNLLVIAAANKQELIEALPRFAPGLVANLSPSRVAGLAKFPGPASAWQIADLVDENGEVATRDPISGTRFFTSFDASRLRKMTQARFAGSVMVVDRNSLAGVSTRQLADYAAMRTLAPVDPLSYRHALSGNPDGELPASSILDLFTGDAAEKPPSLTWWDYAFLQALYAMPTNYPAPGQRAAIERRMRKILASVPSDEL